MLNDTKDSGKNLLKGYNMLLYFAGTMIIYEPAEECIVDFWKQGILKKLPVSSSNPEFIRAASQLRESCTDSGSNTTAMSEDFYRLFRKPLTALAPIFESEYNNSCTAETANSYQNVTDFYNSYGWISGIRSQFKDDHLGVELLFLTTLIEKYLELDDYACHVEMRNEIKRFIEQHLLSWVPEWHKKVNKHSLTISYKGISSLIYASIEDIYSILSEGKKTDLTKSLFRN